MNRSEENTKIIHNQLPLEIKRLVDLAKEREALTLSDNDFHLIKESSLCLYTQPHRESLTELFFCYSADGAWLTAWHSYKRFLECPPGFLLWCIIKGAYSTQMLLRYRSRNLPASCVQMKMTKNDPIVSVCVTLNMACSPHLLYQHLEAWEGKQLHSISV